MTSSFPTSSRESKLSPTFGAAFQRLHLEARVVAFAACSLSFVGGRRTVCSVRRRERHWNVGVHLDLADFGHVQTFILARRKKVTVRSMKIVEGIVR